MGLRRAAAFMAAVVGGLCAQTARAESQTREAIEAVKQLSAPVSRFELRCDLGLLATRQPGQGRAAFDLEIAPRPDYWYGIGAAGILRTTATTTITSSGDVVTATTRADSFGISARIFKRIGPLVLSAGAVDSAGAAGIEVRAFEDRLRFEILATNWRLSDPREVPRVRIGGSAQWRFLYVQTGTLDALEGPLVNAYVGIGLRWRDPDLLPTLRWFRP